MTPPVIRVALRFADSVQRSVLLFATYADRLISLINCLWAAIPPRERIVSCEEVFELKLPLADVVSMQTRPPNLECAGEIPLRQSVKEALRMRPSRIIVGEVVRRSVSTC